MKKIITIIGPVAALALSGCGTNGNGGHSSEYQKGFEAGEATTLKQQYWNGKLGGNDQVPLHALPVPNTIVVPEHTDSDGVIIAAHEEEAPLEQ